MPVTSNLSQFLPTPSEHVSARSRPAAKRPDCVGVQIVIVIRRHQPKLNLTNLARYNAPLSISSSAWATGALGASACSPLGPRPHPAKHIATMASLFEQTHILDRALPSGRNMTCLKSPVYETCISSEPLHSFPDLRTCK